MAILWTCCPSEELNNAIAIFPLTKFHDAHNPIAKGYATVAQDDVGYVIREMNGSSYLGYTLEKKTDKLTNKRNK
jgi:hypothetical protein